MPAHVKIEWAWICVTSSDKPAVIKERLIEAGVDLTLISKAVYVVRASAGFCIDYPSRHSPVLYIGEGRFLQRLRSHLNWIKELVALPGQMPIEVAVSVPKVRNNVKAHREFEAFLLNRFFEEYGSLPLRNKNRENTRFNHTYENAVINEVLGPGKGKRYKWAIRPLKSNPFFKTHRKAPRAPRDQ